MKYLLLLLLLTSCASQMIPSEKGEIRILFCPEDDCEEELIALTKEGEVKCAFYKSTIEIEEMIVHDREYGLMHNKFCVVNESITLTGSRNPTHTENKDNVVVIKSEALAENYLQEWEELEEYIFGWGYEVPNPRIIVGDRLIENYFCTEDECKKHIMEVLGKARKSIHFMTFSFTDSDIAQLLIAKSKEIEVKGMMEGSRANMQYNKFHQMSQHFKVRLYNKTGVLHHKVFVVDGNVVVT